MTSEGGSIGSTSKEAAAKVAGGARVRLSLVSLVSAAGALAVVLAGLLVFARPPAGNAAATPLFLGAGGRLRDWRYIVIHHSATEGGSARAIERYHVYRRRWPRIGYHFVIGNGSGCADGELQVTDTWRRQFEGIHTGLRLYNAKGVAVCLVGNFENAPPSPRQLRTLLALCVAIQKRFKIPTQNVLCHRNISNTKCPGKHFPWEEVVRALEAHSEGLSAHSSR